MKIAFISYEYPPDTAYGGIGTYTYQIANLLTQEGHQVEVFTASSQRAGFSTEGGIGVHRIQLPRLLRTEFGDHIVQLFAERHRKIQFDVVEGAELAAETGGVAQRFPELPRVVKLHTPTYLVEQLNYTTPSLKMKLRRYAGALRRAQWPRPFASFEYSREQDPERRFTLNADEITTPSQALGDILIKQWGLPPDRVAIIPNPYVPSEDLLSIPISRQCDRTVTFVGRLEKRKGILDVAAAIPLVLKHHPDVVFRFVGATGVSPEPPETMEAYLRRKLYAYRHALDFTGAVPLTEIPKIFSQTGICVFPSLWENFPNVCLEAMAAGRGIIGSRAGGMAEMLDGGETGCLIDPQRPKQLVKALLTLLENPTCRMKLGILARERILSVYNPRKIAALQITSYQRAIDRKQSVLRERPVMPFRS